MIINIIYLTVFFIFTMIAFSIYVVLWIFTVPFDKKRRASQWFSRVWSRGIYMLRIGWHVKLEGLENLDKDQTYLILSNHQAMLDIPLILHLKKNFRWVSKKEVYNIPIFGWVLWLRGDVAISRGGASSAKKMVKDCNSFLRQGISIALFPEGTRTKTGEINQFHSGGFLVAKIGKVPILPVVVNGNYGAFDKKTSSIKRDFTVRVLPAITVEEVEELTMEELRDKVEELIKTEYNNICQKK